MRFVVDAGLSAQMTIIHLLMLENNPGKTTPEKMIFATADCLYGAATVRYASADSMRSARVICGGSNITIYFGEKSTVQYCHAALTPAHAVKIIMAYVLEGKIPEGAIAPHPSSPDKKT